MIDFNQALEIILSQAHSFGEEKVPLDKCLDRVLSQEISSVRDLPPFNRCAMDGIAINTEDFHSGIRTFQIAETIFAGQPHTKNLNKGECYKIMTGAAMPPSANAVIQNELIIFEAEKAFVKSSKCLPYQNIARKGQDLKTGQSVINRCIQISPGHIGLFASLGYDKITVKKKPNVAVFTTGNEVKLPGNPLTETQIYNSNAYVINALLKKNGITPEVSSHIPDDPAIIRNILMQHLDNDIIILNGGVSAGDADYIPKILNNLNVECLFHKVAIKPGKPIWCGKTAKGQMVFALPGNPVSCLTTLTLFVMPYIRKCWELDEFFPVFQLPFSDERLKKSGLDEFFLAEADFRSAQIRTTKSNGSGDIRLGLWANAIAFHPKEKNSLTVQDLVSFVLISD